MISLDLSNIAQVEEILLTVLIVGLLCSSIFLSFVLSFLGGDGPGAGAASNFRHRLH